MFMNKIKRTFKSRSANKYEKLSESDEFTYDRKIIPKYHVDLSKYKIKFQSKLVEQSFEQCDESKFGCAFISNNTIAVFKPLTASEKSKIRAKIDEESVKIFCHLSGRLLRTCKLISGNKLSEAGQATLTNLLKDGKIVEALTLVGPKFDKVGKVNLTVTIGSKKENISQVIDSNKSILDVMCSVGKKVHKMLGNFDDRNAIWTIEPPSSESSLLEIKVLK